MTNLRNNYWTTFGSLKDCLQQTFSSCADCPQQHNNHKDQLIIFCLCWPIKPYLTVAAFGCIWIEAPQCCTHIRQTKLSQSHYRLLKGSDTNYSSNPLSTLENNTSSLTSTSHSLNQSRFFIMIFRIFFICTSFPTTRGAFAFGATSVLSTLPFRSVAQKQWQKSPALI